MSNAVLKNISLRGTLAAEFYKRSLDPGITPLELEEFVSQLATSDSADILRIQNDNAMILIGKRSEVGKFPPDW